ncbi:hypothetical protein PPTG_12281 [Phytophthora nicotianae INRA-310]|uniref:Uncharacterized protein n=1 Tax=Phytophthora nicotianae (strain INRA-310) TaxID=761204 RepID=W2Q7H6_PHYN3|nr:hypothetical protein PPTG_12281 [Phytophthora nicotianae INRA-310]ETN08509.1 hypothetical protein PPTG_12281 [Phytophthora nicotianae INRA-310]
MRANHPRFDVKMEAASTTATGTLIPWVCQKASNRYVWIDWIVKGNLPFAFVEMETTRRSHDMELVTKAAEKNIGEELPECFGVILDDCTFGSKHYMTAYDCYKHNGARRCPLISMAPVINVTTARQ